MKRLTVGVVMVMLNALLLSACGAGGEPQATPPSGATPNVKHICSDDKPEVCPK